MVLAYICGDQLVMQELSSLTAKEKDVVFTFEVKVSEKKLQMEREGGKQKERGRREVWAGEIAQWYRTVSAFAMDRIDSQNPHGGSQLSGTPFPENPMPISDL
ncbi:hypothetical protein STEG23_028615 [Scotinomys teguina]